ncbi:hypothetical protein U1Q18_017021, partial [Sarracenia purpurea var. burkii]
ITSPPPQLTFSILCKLCLLGVLRYILEMLTYIGIGFSSPTMASALVNLTPPFTFILAKITGMEKLDLKSKSTQAKFIGTITSILGALTVTFYRGPSLLVFNSPTSTSLHKVFHVSSQHNWMTGGFLLASGSLCHAVLFIVQTWIIKVYPTELMITLVGNIFVSILSITIALIIARDPIAWKLRADIELATILYTAILTVSFRNIVYAWIIRKKGPVFVTMAKPLEMVIAPLMGIVFLGDTLHLGSVIGAFIIALGFYTVLWGKTNEEKTIEDRINSIDSHSDKLPLLQKKSIEG